MDVEQLLRSNFADRADAVAPPDPDLHETVVAGYRRERRLRAGTAAGVLAVALFVSGVSWLNGQLAGRGEAAHPGTDATWTQPSDLYDIPTRGSLAGETELIDRITRLSWDDGVPRDPAQTVEPPVPTRRVLFVGEVPGDQVWALVEGKIRGRTVFAWFAGTGDGPVSLAWGPDYAFPDTPLALTDAAGPSGPLVVVAKPGDQVQVSVLDPDGTPSGGYRPLETVDGIAVGTVKSPAWPLSVEVQVVREGALVYKMPPQQIDTSPSAADPGDAGPPDDRYGLLMSECLHARGFDVTPHPDGSFSYGAARGDVAVEVAYETAVRECVVEMGFE